MIMDKPIITKQAVFLEKLLPGTPDGKEYVRADVREALGLARRLELAKQDENDIEHLWEELPKWYGELANKTDPLSQALGMVGFRVFMEAMKGDVSAAKLFMERYDSNYKPSTRIQGNYLVGRGSDMVSELKRLPDDELQRLAGIVDVSLEPKPLEEQGEGTDGQVIL